MLMTAMHYHQNIISLLLCFLDCVVLANRIQRISSSFRFCSNRELMFTTVDDGKFLSLFLKIQYFLSIMEIFSYTHNA